MGAVAVALISITVEILAVTEALPERIANLTLPSGQRFLTDAWNEGIIATKYVS